MYDSVTSEVIASFCHGITNYESSLEKFRFKFQADFSSILQENNPRILMLFWINFCAQGYGMTEPVENWINRAGSKCKEQGYFDLGKQLCKHAIHEARHELMMVDDTHRLVDRWNKLYSPNLDAEILLKASYSEAVICYRDLHEDYIESETPYCQIAIEYEIENLSTTYGAELLKHTFEILGEDIKDALSFLDEHVRIDVAHTQFNKKVMSDFLSAYPDALKDLINAGEKALTIYGNFLKNCHEQAQIL